MKRVTYALMSKEALINNVKQIKKIAPDASIMAMVKANAYGHGLRTVSKILEPLVEGFGIARLDEALILRRIGITKPINVMHGFLSLDELILCVEQNLTPVIYNFEQLNLLAALNLDNFFIWVKVDTGMNRLGFSLSELNLVFSHECFKSIKYGIMSHFACSDKPFSQNFINQKRNMQNILSEYKCEQYSFNNSAGIWNAPEFNGSWIRVGASLYGFGYNYEYFNPVMSLYCKVLQIRNVARGQFIGYGCHYLDCDKKIAIVDIGYGDGYLRSIGKGYALINGYKADIIGSISMDMLALDVSGIDLALGDNVLLWGRDLPVDVLASLNNKIPYELVTAVHNRVHFIWNEI